LAARTNPELQLRQRFECFQDTVRNTIYFSLLVILAATVNAGSLSLEAHEIATREGLQSNWETSWGSYDRSYHRGKRLLVTIRDLSRKVRRCDVTVYFVARPVFSANDRFIYDRKQFSPEFRGRIEVIGPVDAVDLRARIINIAEMGRRYGRGAEMDGWIVIGEADGRVFDIRASSQTLLEIAQANPRQSQSLKQMELDYEELLEKRRD
jgi:hypothetical protein